MLNAIWATLILVAILCGAWMGNMEAVTQQSVMAAKSAVTLSLGLVGIMAFWLGIMNIAREAGLLRRMADAIRPLMTRLFPEVPADHPAMSMMIMNISANMLGLGNAATPFGLKAMMELDKLNPHKGITTNAMTLFLAINTSGVALLPTGVIAIRAAMGSSNATGIVFTTLFATFCSTTIAIVMAKFLQRLPRYAVADSNSTPVNSTPSPTTLGGSSSNNPASNPSDDTSSPATVQTIQPQTSTSPHKDDHTKNESTSQQEKEMQALESEVTGISNELQPPTWGPWLQRLFWGGLLVGATLHIGQGWIHEIGLYLNSSVGGPQSVGDVLNFPAISLFALSRDIVTFWLLPIIMAWFLLYGISRGVKVYGSLVEGAKEGFDVAIRIIPYLVAILVAIGMFRASGALDLLIQGIGPIVQWFGMPPETLPMALMRPLSGSGALGIMSDTMQAHGPDSLIGIMVSTFQGSTETTFYVIALYFGVVQVKHARHTVIACLLADITGIAAAVWICRVMFG